MPVGQSQSIGFSCVETIMQAIMPVNTHRHVTVSGHTHFRKHPLVRGCMGKWGGPQGSFSLMEDGVGRD